MAINALILFLSVALPALFLGSKPRMSNKSMSYFLVFAGAYLFSMTVIHLIPDLFMSETEPFTIGLWILIGFFLQRVLENFSSGVEHGHSHVHGSSVTVTYLLIALSIHSFLEGSIMSDTVHAHHLPAVDHDHNGTGSYKILLGIVMHKIPAALALMALLTAMIKSKKKALALMLVFALASPLGLIVSEYLSSAELINREYLIIFFALVAGSFLQISTTIFIESDPQHKLNWRKFGVAVLGAAMAVIAQLFV